jgi:hypothetical protein
MIAGVIEHAIRSNYRPEWGARTMRHGLTVVLVIFATGLFGSPQAVKSDEPLEDRIGQRIQPIFLLSRTDVQSDLKMLPKQIADVDRAADALYRKAIGLRGKKGPAVDEERRRLDEELTLWLRTHLTMDQLERLREIDFQWEGAAAMIRPMVTEYLGLSTDQQRTLTQFLAESMEHRRRAGWKATDQTQLTRKAIAVLSDKQKERWADLLGRPCQFVHDAQPQTSSTAQASRVQQSAH